MAITLISAPSNWLRVYDSNRATYKFSSSNYTQANFQFQFDLYVNEPFSSAVKIGTFNIFPLSGGTCEFNPSSIYKNYISYNYNASNTSTTECPEGAKYFQLFCYEFYGTPPTRKLSGAWSGEMTNKMKVYNGCQQNIPYDYIPMNLDGNSRFVMSSGTTKGQFLTDVTEYRLCDTDLCNLWWLAEYPNRPTRVRYTYYYYVTNEVNPDSLGIGGEIRNSEYDEQTTVFKAPYITPTPTGGTTGVEPAPLPTSTYLTSGVSYTDITYTSNNTLQYFTPAGPRTLLHGGNISANWVYYKIDLLSGTTVFNKQPMIVYKNCRSDQYGKWQLCWLNPHGGFDVFTFDRKNEINFKIQRETYKQKLPTNPNFSSYDAGERVFNVTSRQEITLRSDLLTQKEAQILIQLAKSPRVYVNTFYDYGSGTYAYGVPYIIVSDSIRYEQKVNDKEIIMEIKIRPANPEIIQND